MLVLSIFDAESRWREESVDPAEKTTESHLKKQQRSHRVHEASKVHLPLELVGRYHDRVTQSARGSAREDEHVSKGKEGVCTRRYLSTLEQITTNSLLMHDDTMKPELQATSYVLLRQGHFRPAVVLGVRGHVKADLQG